MVKRTEFDKHEQRPRFERVLYEKKLEKVELLPKTDSFAESSRPY